ncbi:MAG: flagellar export chaperone FliS [Terriglobales bacterium]
MNIQQSYREAAVRGANPVQLVVRLYEQMIQDMRQVAIAIEQNDIEGRSIRIKHALLVMAHLQSTLDFARGGKVAHDLNHFYDALRQNVVWVQFHPSKRAAAQVITDLLAVREAWMQVEQAENPSTTVADRVVTSGAPDPRFDVAHDFAGMDWKG